MPAWASPQTGDFDNAREAFVLSSLAFMVLLLGVWPAPLIEVMDVTVTRLVEQIAVSKL